MLNTTEIVNAIYNLIDTAIKSGELSFKSVQKYTAEYPDIVGNASYPYVAVDVDTGVFIRNTYVAEDTIDRVHSIVFGIWCTSSKFPDAIEQSIALADELQSFIQKNENRITPDGHSFQIQSSMVRGIDETTQTHYAGNLIACEFNELIFVDQGY